LNEAAYATCMVTEGERGRDKKGPTLSIVVHHHHRHLPSPLFSLLLSPPTTKRNEPRLPPAPGPAATVRTYHVHHSNNYPYILPTTHPHPRTRLYYFTSPLHSKTSPAASPKFTRPSQPSTIDLRASVCCHSRSFNQSQSTQPQANRQLHLQPQPQLNLDTRQPSTNNSQQEAATAPAIEIGATPRTK